MKSVCHPGCERQLHPNLVEAGWIWGCAQSRSDLVQSVNGFNSIELSTGCGCKPPSPHLHSAVTPDLPRAQYVQLDLLSCSRSNCNPSRFRTFSHFLSATPTSRLKHSFTALFTKVYL